MDLAIKNTASALYFVSYFHINNEVSRRICEIVYNLHAEQQQSDEVNQDKELITNCEAFFKFEKEKRQAQWQWIQDKCSEDIKEEVKALENLDIIKEIRES